MIGHATERCCPAWAASLLVTIVVADRLGSILGRFYYIVPLNGIHTSSAISSASSFSSSSVRPTGSTD